MLKEAKEKVKTERTKLNMTQQELADKVKVSRSTIGMIENDEVYTPSTNLAKSLGKLFDFDWTIFFE